MRKYLVLSLCMVLLCACCYNQKGGRVDMNNKTGKLIELPNGKFVRSDLIIAIKPLEGDPENKIPFGVLIEYYAGGTKDYIVQDCNDMQEANDLAQKIAKETGLNIVKLKR